MLYCKNINNKNSSLIRLKKSNRESVSSENILFLKSIIKMSEITKSDYAVWLVDEKKSGHEILIDGSGTIPFTENNEVLYMNIDNELSISFCVSDNKIKEKIDYSIEINSFF